jgi:hypothetical protein
MNQEELDRKFENLWRIYGNFGKMNQNQAVMSFDEFFEYIKELCRKFFTGGVAVGESASEQVSTPGQKEYAMEIVCHDFGYWWKIYDLKVGKEKCMQKWAKMTVKDREACIAATPAYVASTPDKQFRKRPLTYLNGKCWNDEIIIKQNGTDKPTIEQQRINKLASILTE